MDILLIDPKKPLKHKVYSRDEIRIWQSLTSSNFQMLVKDNHKYLEGCVINLN